MTDEDKLAWLRGQEDTSWEWLGGKSFNHLGVTIQLDIIERCQRVRTTLKSGMRPVNPSVIPPGPDVWDW